ncbi:MAG: DUF3857 and transglutaminase domain-containing protein [Phycisphaerae bacterium]|nr:DUF3857 and transglutaminase domain-containing protein [Phycisphaerae bacterium]
MTDRTVAKGCVTLAGLLGWFVAAATAGIPQPATNDEIKELITKTGEAKDYDNADLVYVLDEADVYVQDSGLATTESCQVIKVLTDAGIRSQAVLKQEFDPATNRVTLKSVRIHRKEGGIEDVPLSSMITQPAPQHWIYWGNQQHLLDVPRVEIGDCVEIRISKIGFNIAYLGDASATAGGGGAETLQPPMPGHWYEVTRFQNNYPIIKKRYSVYMPKDKPVQFEVYNGELKSSLWFDDDYHAYSFWAEDIPRHKREPHQVAPDDYVIKLVMATVPDWEMKSRWFFEANESQFDSDDAIRAKVAELTEGLEDDEAKIAALNHWVADNIRYYGTSRGPREGFTLHSGIETFHDRGGVCKDKAGMLITMLRAAGYESYPALTMAGPRVEDIPADQFNHTISVIRNKDGTFTILDPTWIPLSRDMWSPWEALQGLVYGTPEGQTLTLSPHFPPEHNQFVSRGESEIDAGGALSTQISMEVSGRPDTSFRRKANKYSQPEQRAAFESVLSIAPNARLEAFEFTDPFDYTHNAKIELKVSAEGYAAGSQQVHMFRLPLMSHPLGRFIIPDLFYSVDAEKRNFGMRFHATRLVRYEETLKLPDGWKIEHVPEKQELDSNAATLSFEAIPGDGELTYKFEFTIKHNRIPAEDYPELKKALDTMREIADDWIVCIVDK